MIRRQLCALLVLMASSQLVAVDIHLEMEATTLAAGPTQGTNIALEQSVTLIEATRSLTGTTELRQGILSIRDGDNQAPIITDANVAIPQNAAVHMQIIATDADGDPLVFGISTPTNGSIGNFTPSTGSFTFTPPTHFTGLVSIPVSAGDGWGMDTGFINVAVTSQNPYHTGLLPTQNRVRPWIVNRPPLTAYAGEQKQWTVQVDTSALTNPALSFLLINPPSGLSMNANAQAGTAALNWQVANSASGVASFQVLVIDQQSNATAIQNVSTMVQSTPLSNQ